MARQKKSPVQDGTIENVTPIVEDTNKNIVTQTTEEDVKETDTKNEEEKIDRTIIDANTENLISNNSSDDTLDIISTPFTIINELDKMTKEDVDTVKVNEIRKVTNKSNVIKYVAKYGDTMESIAVRFGVRLNKLLVQNPQVGKRLLPGQVINIYR